MNAPGLRNQRLRLYRRIDQGSDGFVTAAFLFTVERWGRLDESGATTQNMQQRLQMKLDAVAEFSNDVQVPPNGIITDTLSGRSWWVRGVNEVRQLRRLCVDLERISDEQFREFRLYDSESQLDGTHLVNPA